MKNFTLSRQKNLSLRTLRLLSEEHHQLKVNKVSWSAIKKSAECLHNLLEHGEKIYGVNTGFGKLADVLIKENQLERLQYNLVVSHSVGTGPLLADEIVRLIMLLKLQCFIQGYSGVRPELIEQLIQLHNAKIYPCIPAKGSLGASGDLAPLAHMAQSLIGLGHVRFKNKILPTQQACKSAGIKPLSLAAKEGLSLINGTQVSTALALANLFIFENIFIAALISGALSLVASRGQLIPFDVHIQLCRGQKGQIEVAQVFRELLYTCEFEPTNRTQDPYSLRCQPQVMGACLDHLRYAANIFEIEANAVTDNPLIFSINKTILSGGNFHGQPIAMAADTLALAIAEVGNLSERRIALLLDQQQSGLPYFLVAKPGINSGFMIAQVTAAALASENKSLAHPASVDSIPTSANQEDHVSMSTFAARRLAEMNENTATIIAIELLAACQGIDLSHPKKLSRLLKTAYETIRSYVTFLKEDRILAQDIAQIKNLIKNGTLNSILSEPILPSL